MKIKIFYSWQTTTDSRYNRNFISGCIQKAVNILKNKPQFKGLTFEILDGVRGEPGSQSVATKITDDRIPSCDIFIADLSVVNNISKTKKFIRYIIGDTFKPFQNNNVINEHGVALNAIGVDGLIGVLNSAFGSPNDNPQNIPFDLRHLSFPIEYNYSKKTNDRDQVQSAFVNHLSSALKVTVENALKRQKNRYRPFIMWNQWEELTSHSQKFYKNEKIDEIINHIKTQVKNPKESTRLVGLSGLGKTRILLEAFRVVESEPESILLNSKVLYINYNNNTLQDYNSIFSKLKEDKENRVVIIDNCPKQLHRQLMQFVKTNNNLISLITIDSNPEELEQDRINDINYLLFKKEDLSSVVSDILEADFSFLSEDNVKKIKEFSQGIPLMAVLIGESIKNGEKFIGKLDDKELLNKLLGEKGQEQRSRTILKACSIFNFFGYEGELSSQLEFIATDKNITSLTGDNQVIINEFNETCEFFLKREIFERRGRLIGMRPFPLAMYLAQEWLEPCTPERLMDIISSISKLKDFDKKNLSEAIAEQMKYLGFNSKAVEIIDKIVGINGPFDNAEVLNTELGSRLFRSFVEVNPVAVSENLVRLFSASSKEDLLKIQEGRRNIIWILEKLCFDQRTFKDSVKILFAFAVAENETWANNARGQFLHLFKILLPGTEANLKDRIEIIEWGLKKENKDFNDLAIKAMKSGLDYGHFSRMGGAEVQGGKSLIDFHPNLEQIQEYWTFILLKLNEIVKDKNEYSDSAAITIADSIRSISSLKLANIIIPIVEEIVVLKNNDWDDGLKGLKYARKYEKGNLTESQLSSIETLIIQLTKTDFTTRYKSPSTSNNLDDDEIFSTERTIEVTKKLADEFINEGLSWDEYLPLFYSTQQPFSYYFGKRIYEIIDGQKDRVDEFLKLSVKILKSVAKDSRNLSFLGDFITDSNNEIKSEFYSLLSEDLELNYALFYLISNDLEGKKYFDLLFEMVDNGKCELSNFKAFTYSNSLNKCSLEELQAFSDKLFNYNEEGYELVFDLFFYLGYGDDQLKKSLLPILKKCIYFMGINTKASYKLDSYMWNQTICNILEFEDDNKFAIFINNSIIESISWENSYHLDGEVQKIYEILMVKYFDVIWDDLSKALLSTDDEYSKFYGLKHILGSRIGGVGRSVGVLFSGNIEKIFEWGKLKSPLAPSRLAELVPIYDGNNNQYENWNNFSKRLIDEFGDNEEVLQNLSMNMGNYSWTGSVVPLLEAKKKLFSSINNHNTQLVSDWSARQLIYLEDEIKREKDRDEERFF